MNFRFCLTAAAALLAAASMFTACNKETTTAGSKAAGAASRVKSSASPRPDMNPAGAMPTPSPSRMKPRSAASTSSSSTPTARSTIRRKALADFIAQRVNIIMLEPNEVDGWDSLLKDAKAANIPVIIGDRNVSAPPGSLRLLHWL